MVHNCQNEPHRPKVVVASEHGSEKERVGEILLPLLEALLVIFLAVPFWEI